MSEVVGRKHGDEQELGQLLREAAQLLESEDLRGANQVLMRLAERLPSNRRESGTRLGPDEHARVREGAASQVKKGISLNHAG